jgi:hypothetical protein
MSNYFENNELIDAWLAKRWSMFTSSEDYKLFPNSRQGNELWSTTAKTYIETKVIELTTKMYQRPDMDEVEALRHGKANEYPSFERYVYETKNYSMTYMGDENPIFIPCTKLIGESGGTPDVGNIISADEGTVKIDYGAELKNPVNPAYHFRRLKWRTQWDIKEGYPSAYCQIQDLIRLTGAFGWDFVSHDERQLSKAAQIKIIEVKPDQKFIDNLEIRIELAIKAKYKLLSEHMGTELKNRNDYLNFLKQ